MEGMRQAKGRGLVTYFVTDAGRTQIAAGEEAAKERPLAALVLGCRI